MPNKKTTKPPQHQNRQPGIQSEMDPLPKDEKQSYIGSGKLAGKVAIITGGDSGIGRSVGILFAREGADIVVSYLDEHNDAEKTQSLIEKEGRKCVLIAGDVGDEEHCKEIVDKTIKDFGKIDILVNNAGEQHDKKSIKDISRDQLERTFRTNIFSFFFMTKAVLPHLSKGSAIINTTSVTAYRGNPVLLDYSSTKGAIVSFTRSLALNLASEKIRVNAVAPGPIWTPLIPASFSKERVSKFGAKQPLGRPGEPEEVAPSYVFLASDDSSYMSGQVLHPNGGEVVNG